MASPDRSTSLHGTFDTEEPVLDAEPLSFVPYSGRPTSASNNASASQATEEMGIVLGSTSDTVDVMVTGSAAMGEIGPIVRLFDMGECGDSYYFRVALPGVRRAVDVFQCKIESNGKVTIGGITTTGEKTVHRYRQKFCMRTANLCPPGPFSISFQLPGPVNHFQFAADLCIDGTIEGVIKKSENSVVQ